VVVARKEKGCAAIRRQPVREGQSRAGPHILAHGSESFVTGWMRPAFARPCHCCRHTQLSVTAAVPLAGGLHRKAA